MSSADSFGTRSSLTYGTRHAHYFSLTALEKKGFPGVARLPFSLKILLENLLRHEDGRFVKRADIEALAGWDVKRDTVKEISFAPARVLLQDFTGVPCVSTSRRCATASCGSAAIRAKSTRCSR